MKIASLNDLEVVHRKEAAQALEASPHSVRVRARAGSFDGQQQLERLGPQFAAEMKAAAAAAGINGVAPPTGAAAGGPRHHVPGALSHRLQAMLWVALQTSLLFIMGNLLSVVTVAHKDLFGLYYAPLFPLLAMLWFWGVFVAYAERHHVRYEVCFSAEDQKYLMHSAHLFRVSNVLTTVVLASACAFLFHCSILDAYTASFHPPILYLGLLALILNPTNVLFKETRLFFSTTAWRVFTPLRSVTWADFLLADVLTSLAKPLSDTERAVCHLMTGPVMSPVESRCGSASLVIPVGLALPYFWRFVQCIRVFLDTGARPQLWNAVKYSTAFPVIILSSMQYHVDRHTWFTYYKPLWLAAALLNSCYSYVWDIERDWEIQFFSLGVRARTCTPPPVLQPHLLYRRPFYLYLMASNFFLRLAWTHKLSPHLRRNQFMAFMFVVMEGFRRFQWLFVRIEVELRKIQAYRPELGLLVPPAGQHLTGLERADSGVDDKL